MDTNLLILKQANNDDLKVLADFLHLKSNGSKRCFETFSTRDSYKKYYPHNMSMMVEDIADELQLNGGNTFANIFRGFQGVEYKEILIDVCNKLKVPFNKDSDVEVIELCLLQTILINSLEDMSEEELAKLISEMNIPNQGVGKQAMIAAIQIAIKRGGFSSYKLAVIVANAICKALLGRGLSIAANAALTRWLSIFAGPIGWTAVAVWTAIDIAGPAYRITIPAVIQVAYIRAKVKFFASKAA
jgi:uncharacterized protein YaaW (UPF0174 family)